MREGWEIKSLPDCLEKSPKASKIPKKDFKSRGKYPVVSQEKGLINGYWDNESDVVRVDQPFVLFGDHTQVVKLVDFSFVVGADGVKLLKPKPFLDPWYFYYFLIGHPLKTLGYARHFRLLKELNVVVPPLPEQKRIVAILDEAFAGIDTAIANTERNLANARELFESYLNAVFSQRGEGWADLTLREVCTDYGRGKSKHRPRNDPKLFSGKYPFIQTGDVRNSDHLITGYSTTYNESGLAQSKLWPKGTICITIAANIAETGILDFDACFPDSIIGLVIDETKASSTYVEFLLQSVRSILKAKGKGSAQDNINLATFENEKFPFPPLKNQLAVVERLREISSSVRQLESNYQQKLATLAELKQSLLQKAFSGELTADNVAPITSAKKSSATPATTSPIFAAHIMAAAYHWHESKSKNKTFGRVKAQKTLHLVEALARIDLGRVPVKDAAGPNDFSHMRTAETWARENDFYQFVQRVEGQRGYDFVKGKRYNEWLSQALDALEPYKSPLDRVVSLLMPLDTQKAELVATAYAAWNNLLLDGHKPSEADIVHEARDNWHRDKQQYTESQFREAIARLRDHGMVPTGTGKRVTGQESLEL